MLGLATCSSPRTCTTAPSSIATAPAATDFAYVLGDATACRRRRSGPRGSPASRPTTFATWRGAWRRAARWSPSTWSLQRAEHGEQPVWMGDRAGGDARPDRAAGRRLRLRLRLDRSNVGTPPLAVPLPTLPPGPQPGRRLHPGRARSPTCCCTRASTLDFDGERRTTPTSGWSTGPAATRSTTTRTSAGCAARWRGRTRSSCTSRAGRRRPATPTSCCPATTTLERDDIGGARSDPLLVAMHRAVPPSARRATTTTIFAALAERLGVGEALHRGPHGRANGSRTSTSELAARWPRAAATRRLRRVLGARASWSCRPRRRDGAVRAFRADPRRTRCRRRAAGSSCLRDHRRLRLRRLPRPPDLAGARRVAGRRRWRSGSRCS